MPAPLNCGKKTNTHMQVFPLLSHETLQGAQATIEVDHALRIVSAMLTAHDTSMRNAGANAVIPGTGPSKMERQLHITAFLTKWKRGEMAQNITHWGLQTAVNDALATLWTRSGRDRTTRPRVDIMEFYAVPDPDMRFHTKVFRPPARDLKRWAGGDALEAYIPAPVPIKRASRAPKATPEDVFNRIVESAAEKSGNAPPTSA